jgi:type I restriction enzyme S subunit
MRYRLGDVCESASVTFRRKLDKVVLINTSDVLDGKVLNHTYTPNENLRGQFKKSFQQNDILYSEIRPKNKRFAYVDFDSNDYVASTKLMVIRANDKILPEFLFQVLKSAEIIDQLQVLAETRSGTFPQITFSELAAIDFDLPPLPTQRAIAGTLSCLDDKIELNRRINANLETQAQALFKSWFVDFDPWGGKMPGDWWEGALGDYCSMKSGFAFKSSWWQQDGIRVIKIKNITNNGFDFSDCSFVSKDKMSYAKDFAAAAGDLLIAMTGATIGKFAIVPQCDEALLVNQRVGKFFLGANPLDRLPFLWCLLKHDKVFKEIVNRGQGSAQPNISPTDIMTISAIIPSDEVLANFNESLRSCFETMTTNAAENKKLAAIRDTLLPRLMSGEIEVEE